MFILREITKSKLEINTGLDIEYVLVLREKNNEDFKERTLFWNEEDSKDVYGLVCFDGGDSIMPLRKESSYYIMTSDGKTFSNISVK